ncbi:MAG: leucine-rich repeat protein [Christensenellales bacterium]|nr:leucine-rich repeat protein [Clostridiales bacterium]
MNKCIDCCKIKNVGQLKPEMPENTEFVIKDRIVSLSDYAFFGCSNLLSITILKSVTSIGMYEFAKCSNLTKIIYKGTKAELGALKKDYGWDLESSLKEIYCTDGKINFFFTSRITFLSNLKNLKLAVR